MRHITIIAAMMLALSVSASAHKNCGEDWKAKMMSEKIAFLANEMGITPEEAQTFWPVYNEIQKEKDKAMHKAFKTFKALNDALEAGSSKKDVAELLDNYLDALDEQRKLEEESEEEFRKVLPVEKVAKLYVGEEKFRRQQIRKMKGHHEQKPGHRPGPKPEIEK